MAGHWPAALRRAAHGRRGAASGLGCRDAHRRGQDPGLHPAGVPQRPHRRGRPRGHRQRLPGEPRRRLDGPDPPLVGPQRRSGRPRRARSGLQARAVRLRHHLRHQQRVRFRLPAGQHGALRRRADPARPSLLHRGRDRLDPHRRGPHAADHQRPGGRGRQHLLPVRLHRAQAGARRALRGGRGEAHGGPHRGRCARRGAGPGGGEPLRLGAGQLRAPPRRGAAGQGAVPARQGVHPQRRRGEDRRRVHRAHPRRAPLVRRPAPGHRGQGGHQDPGGEPDPRHDHPAELLPPLREAGRHDRHRPDRGQRAARHLRPAGGLDTHPQAHGPRRSARPGVPHRGRQVRRHRGRHRRAGGAGPAGAGGHHLGGEVREAVGPPNPQGHRARGAERQATRPRGRDHRPSRPSGAGDGGHQHGRTRGRHHPGRQPGIAGPARPAGRRARPPVEGVRQGVPQAAGEPYRAVQRRGRVDQGTRRSLRRRHRTSREPSHRQPAAGALGPPGRPGGEPLLPVPRGRPHAHLRHRRHELGDVPLDGRQRAHRVQDGHQVGGACADHRGAAQRRDPQERAPLRRGDEQPAQGHLPVARADPRGGGVARPGPRAPAVRSGGDRRRPARGRTVGPPQHPGDRREPVAHRSDAGGPGGRADARGAHRAAPGRRHGAVRQAGDRDRRRGHARPRAPGDAAGHRPALAHAPLRDGLPEGGHPPACRRPEGSAERVAARGLRDVRRSHAADQAGLRAHDHPHPGGEARDRAGLGDAQRHILGSHRPLRGAQRAGPGGRRRCRRAAGRRQERHRAERRRQARRGHRHAGAQPGGEDRPQRALPVWLGQEVQALLRSLATPSPPVRCDAIPFPARRPVPPARP